MVVIVDFTNELFNRQVSRDEELVHYSTLTNCTKTEMYELFFGITEVDELPDIDYYRKSFDKFLPSTERGIFINMIKNLNPSIVIYDAHRDDDINLTGYCAELSAIPAKLHIRLLGKHKNLTANVTERVYWIELNDKKIIINEELSDETTRKILFTQMMNFYRYTDGGSRRYKDINTGCLTYLKQKIIKNAMLDFLKQKNNRKQEILGQIAELQKELNGL